MRKLYQSVVVKRQLRVKEKLSIYRQQVVGGVVPFPEKVWIKQQPQALCPRGMCPTLEHRPSIAGRSCTETTACQSEDALYFPQQSRSSINRRHRKKDELAHIRRRGMMVRAKLRV
ncbi:SWI/SNF-related matrix-associated actin-dependent regulator of chromatin subfamily A member 5 [Sarotherodon galilaeus]